jgi:uroporphyrinogen-III synthase
MAHAAPLAGRRIVITRPDPDAARLAERLRNLGAIPILAPAIEIEFTDPPELARAVARISEYDWVVFTSKNGVEAVFRLAREIRRKDKPRIAAIGPATAEALRRRGIEADLVPQRYVAEAILEALGDVSGLKILLPRSEIARRTLVDGLKARGAIVEEIAAYRTRSRSSPGATDSGEESLAAADAITFTSSSTVRGFVESRPMPRGAKIVCIGPITAKTAAEYGLRVDAVAERYTEDGLISALLDLFREPRESGR